MNKGSARCCSPDTTRGGKSRKQINGGTKLKPEEKMNNIIRTALEIMKQNGSGEGPALTFDQALKVVQVEQVWRIASIANQIRVSLDELTEEIRENVSGALEQTCTRLSDLDRTLFDTLGSEKYGAALDALAEIPRIIEDK